MAEAPDENENQENDSLLDILQYGKELYQEIQRKLFTVSSEEAEGLKNRAKQFTIHLVILSRTLVISFLQHKITISLMVLLTRCANSNALCLI